MIRQDYILRLIEQLARVLAQIFGLKDAAKYQEASSTVDQAFQQFLGLDSRFIDTIPDADLIALLKVGDVLDVEKCVVAACLLKAKGDMLKAQNRRDESYNAHLKALNVFLELFINYNNIDLLSSIVEMEALIEKLDTYELPIETMNRLWQYYEKIGKYSKAEDVLHEILKASYYESDVLDSGISFYQRLMAKSDDDLIAGELPQREVEEGFAELIEIRNKKPA